MFFLLRVLMMMFMYVFLRFMTFMTFMAFIRFKLRMFVASASAPFIDIFILKFTIFFSHVIHHHIIDIR